MNDQIRSMTITTLPNRTFVLLKFMNIWREIWTDGRALPTNFARGDAHDPTYNGYSVGRWEDDYTFVVETTGMAPETWATESGYPHSVDARVTERFQRKSKNDLTLTMTMDDPKLYTKPVSLGVVHFRWIPSQTFFDFSCVPSSVQRYLKEMADPPPSPLWHGSLMRDRQRNDFWRCTVKTKVVMVILFVALAAINTPSFAHHGAVAFDMNTPVVLKNAVVTEFLWINPHPLIKADYTTHRAMSSTGRWKWEARCRLS